MIVSCESCAATLQMDESKAPSDSFTIRCPKCGNLVRVRLHDDNSQNGGSTPKQNLQQNPQSAPERAGGESKNWEPPQPSSVYKAPETASEGDSDPLAGNENGELLKMLAGLLTQSGGEVQNASAKSVGKHALRRILLCLSPEQRETASRSLAEAGYEIYLADTATQALETMRETNIEIVVFSSQFAAQHNGAKALQKYFDGLLASERRKLFAAAIDDVLQTFDSHEAFLRNLNLIVHSSDLRNLSHVLKRALREFDEIYRDFNHALAA